MPPKKDGNKRHERESSAKIMGIELHAIEVYVSASANGMDTVNSATSTRDVVGGEANAQDIAKKNMWPLFELRFVSKMCSISILHLLTLKNNTTGTEHCKQERCAARRRNHGHHIKRGHHGTTFL